MTASQRNPSLQDMQIAANALNVAFVEGVPTVRHFSESFARAIRPWLEQRNQMARMAQENREFRQKVQELERQLELKQYADQDWFST